MSEYITTEVPFGSNGIPVSLDLVVRYIMATSSRLYFELMHCAKVSCVRLFTIDNSSNKEEVQRQCARLHFTMRVDGASRMDHWSNGFSGLIIRRKYLI